MHVHVLLLFISIFTYVLFRNLTPTFTIYCLHKGLGAFLRVQHLLASFIMDLLRVGAHENAIKSNDERKKTNTSPDGSLVLA